MEDTELLARMGVFTRRAPRYTSYPTAAHFATDIDGAFFRQQLQDLPIVRPISLYLHIPFCERLCWFCACRTQGTHSSRPVKNYLEVLKTEIAMVAQQLPKGIKMGRLHWGGGTPTILTPDMIDDLNGVIFKHFTPAENFEFSVEIDPTLVDQAKILALKAGGMTRASIGVQDFAPRVQAAIGRAQTVAQTQACCEMLRAAGIQSLNMDILYGLPHQTRDSVLETVAHVGSLAPDRIALYGYAHVPWMAKRQQMINESALPDGPLRRGLFTEMTNALTDLGMTPIGIDHFATPNDSLTIAAKSGSLRRNFQGYTTDQCDTLIGMGASAISRLPGGYAQNAPKSSQYLNMIGTGKFATQRGIACSTSDRLRARAIEQVMCNFTLDLGELQSEFGPDISELEPVVQAIKDKFGDAIEFFDEGFVIRNHRRALARLIAVEFDDYVDENARYSTVS